MKASTTIKEKIKNYEGLCLKAIKCVPTEKYWTIGYGHYGVNPNATITKQEADKLFDEDLIMFENWVNNPKYNPHINNCTQEMFDALLCFTYNCGVGNLQKLTKNKLEDIPIKILQYNKSGGKVLNGLTKRRTYESELFKKGLSKIKKTTVKNNIKVGDKVKVLNNIVFGTTNKRFKVFFGKYDVIQVNANRVVIGIGKTVTTAIDISNIEKV